MERKQRATNGPNCLYSEYLHFKDQVISREFTWKMKLPNVYMALIMITSAKRFLFWNNQCT